MSETCQCLDVTDVKFMRDYFKGSSLENAGHAVHGKNTQWSSICINSDQACANSYDAST